MQRSGHSTSARQQIAGKEDDEEMKAEKATNDRRVKSTHSRIVLGPGHEGLIRGGGGKAAARATTKKAARQEQTTARVAPQAIAKAEATKPETDD